MDIVVELRLDGSVVAAIEETEEVVLFLRFVRFSGLRGSDVLPLEMAVLLRFCLVVDGPIEGSTLATVGVWLFSFHIYQMQSSIFYQMQYSFIY